MSATVEYVSSGIYSSYILSPIYLQATVHKTRTCNLEENYYFDKNRWKRKVTLLECIALMLKDSILVKERTIDYMKPLHSRSHSNHTFRAYDVDVC